jgi:hypothetical protein
MELGCYVFVAYALPIAFGYKFSQLYTAAMPRLDPFNGLTEYSTTVWAFIAFSLNDKLPLLPTFEQKVCSAFIVVIEYYISRLTARAFYRIRRKIFAFRNLALTCTAGLVYSEVP